VCVCVCGWEREREREREREKLKTCKYDENLATPFRPAEKYGIASTAFAAIMATESEGVTKNLINKRQV
jgi:hypothetical protein